ncbi:MAG: hypothetical protein JXA42_01730 [Anaerolineales bacterium]|nr:hypothetical protein [Anaerolineales bacterium]
MFKQLSFNDAVSLFKEWGFQIEPGPMPGEITLIIEEGSYRVSTVFQADNLSEIAAFVLKVRWDNGLMAPSVVTDGWDQLTTLWWVANPVDKTILPPN